MVDLDPTSLTEEELDRELEALIEEEPMEVPTDPSSIDLFYEGIEELYGD